MAANDDWYYAKNGQQLGPVSAADLKQLAATGQLLASDFIWKEEWPEWKAAGKVKGLFTAEPPAMPVPPPLPPPSGNTPASRSLPPTANVAGTMQAGLADIMSTAKQAKDLAAAHARRTQITQMTLPKAYLALGKDVFLNERFRDELSDLFQRITATNDEISKVATTTKERPQATDLKGKLQSGAAQLMAQGQTTKLGYQRESLVRELGKKAFESHGTSAGPPELVSPITSANDEIARLDEQIAGLSSGKQGSIWQRLPLAALLTVFCWPVGMLLVWFNPRLTRRSKWIWTGVSAGAFLVLVIIAPKSNDSTSSTRRSDFYGMTAKPGDHEGVLTDEYLTTKAGHVADFTGKLLIGEDVVSHRIRETCTKPSTIQCKGTSTSFVGGLIEGEVNGKRELHKSNGFVVVRGLYPHMLTGASSDSSIADYRLIKSGAKPGDAWDDGRMKFVGFRDGLAVIEETIGEPSAEYVIRREFHLRKGVGIVFHRQTVGGELSHEYKMTDGLNGDLRRADTPSIGTPRKPTDDLEVIKHYSTFRYSNSRIPVFLDVPDDIVKQIPKEQMQIVTQIEKLCQSAEQRLTAAATPAIVAKVEAEIKREQADLMQGFTIRQDLPGDPIRGWVGQIHFSSSNRFNVKINLGRLTEIRKNMKIDLERLSDERPTSDPTKDTVFVSDVVKKAFVFYIFLEDAKKDLLADIALLKEGDWVKIDLPDYQLSHQPMLVTVSYVNHRPFAIHGDFAVGNERHKQSARITKIRSCSKQEMD